MNDILIHADGIRKSFQISSRKIEVLRGVSATVGKGEWVALLGASGSGKTTLLDILGTLSKPDTGSLTINGQNMLSLSSRALSVFRRQHIGFVFQSYHLLPELTILENVMLPVMLEGLSKKAASVKAAELLEMTGLKERLAHRPNELSGGEQQRAAIARSLMNEPELILADEPTGNLDSVTGKEILSIFQTIHREKGSAIVMVTHDASVAALAQRKIELRDGVILS